MTRSAQLLFIVLLSGMFGGACATRPTYSRVNISLRDIPVESYSEIETSGALVVTNEEEAIRRALERDPNVELLREAVRVAWAEARTIPDLRDPEIGVAFARGDRITERTWIVPRAELLPSLAYPNRGIYVTSHPEDLGLSTDPRIPRVVVPPGGEGAYLERSPRSYKATTADSDMLRATIRFFPPNPFIISAKLASLRANYAASVADLRQAEWNVRSRVRWLWTRLRFLRQDIARLNEITDLRKRLAENLEVMAGNGQVPALDAIVAAQQYLKSVSERGRLVAEESLLRAELEERVGTRVELPAGYVEAGKDFHYADIPPMDYPKIVLEHRFDVAAAYWRAQSAEAVLRQAKLARIPWFTHVEGSLSRARRRDREEVAWELQRGSDEIDALYSIPVDETEDSEWRIEAMVNIPLFSMGPRATRVGDAERKRAWTQLSVVTRDALAAAKTAIAQWRQAYEHRAETQSLLEPQLTHARELLEAMRAGGGMSVNEQTRLRVVVLEMFRAAAAREADLAEAQLRAEQAFGAPLDEQLGTAVWEASARRDTSAHSHGDGGKGIEKKGRGATGKSGRVWTRH